MRQQTLYLNNNTAKGWDKTALHNDGHVQLNIGGHRNVALNLKISHGKQLIY
jgi:hypothetical protein